VYLIESSQFCKTTIYYKNFLCHNYHDFVACVIAYLTFIKVVSVLFLLQNASQSWYTDHPEFTACQETIIVFGECGIFLIVFLFYFIYLFKLQSAAVVQNSHLFYLKMVST